ncbi:MAG TPA: GxxExxY protein [Methylomirabilota bacterium]|nr:GxxExxY protein [Methylomirabilota bacterium]
MRQTAYEIHRYLGHGHLEKIHENALAHRLTKIGIPVRQQHPLAVYDEDGTPLGNYFSDLLIREELLVEIKACRAFTDEHVAQLLGYLRSSRLRHGLLINFGSFKFEIKKYVLD